MQQAMLDIFEDKTFDANVPGGVNLKYEEESYNYLHSDWILGERPLGFANSLLKHNWYVGINTTKIPFVISDNPVNHNGAGFAQPNLELYFPINPKHVLIIYGDNIRLYSKKINKRQKIEINDEGLINLLNACQIRSSYLQCAGSEDSLIQAKREFSIFFGDDFKRTSNPIIVDGAGKGRIY